VSTAEKVTIEVPAGSVTIPKTSLLGADQMPVDVKGHNWGSYTMSALYFGLIFNMTILLGMSALILGGLNWIQLSIAMVVGAIVTVGLFWLNSFGGLKYGINHTVQLRSAFGNRVGSYIPSVLRAAIALIWYGIQSWLIAMSIDVILQTFTAWGGLDYMSRMLPLFVVATGIQYIFLHRSYSSLRILEQWGAPLCLLGLILMVIWGRVTAGTWGPIIMQEGDYGVWAPFSMFVFAVALCIAGYATVAINISDITRVTTNEKVNRIASLVFIPIGWLTAGLLAVGMLSMAVHMGWGPVWNPIEWLGHFPHGILAAIVLVLVIAAGITTNAPANILSPVTTLTNLFKKLNFRKASIIASVVSLGTVPWIFLSHPETFLAMVSRFGGTLGAIIGIMIVDWWVFRKSKPDIAELYEPEGIYKYWKGGINWIGIGALVVGMACGWAFPTYNLFISLFVGALVYYVVTLLMMRTARIRRSLPSR